MSGMENKTGLTKVLATAGTLLVWFPILAPVGLSVMTLLQSRQFRLDYLMPAELFPFALVGGGLLSWAAFRAHSHLKLLGWSLGLAIALLFGSQALAVVTGLASGETEPTGGWWALVLASLVGYTLAVVAMGVGGGFVLRDLYTRPGLSTTRR